MDKPAVKCSNCTYWQLLDSPSHEVIGECRFDPPTFHPVMEKHESGETRHSMMQETVSDRDSSRPKRYLAIEQSFWPVTRGEDWCGKFQQRPIPQDHRTQ